MKTFVVIGYGRMGIVRERILSGLGMLCIGIHDPKIGKEVNFQEIKPDMAIICTPPDAHSYWVSRMKEQGVARIFVEKPYYDKEVWVGWSHRYHSAIEEIRKYDDIVLLEIKWVRRNGIPAGWFVESSSGWDDLGVHLADLSSYILRKNPINESIAAYDFSGGDITYKANWWGGDSWNYKTNDSAVSLIKYEGAVAILKVAWAGVEDDQFVITVTRKRAEFGVAYNIDTMNDDIFEKEIKHFLAGEPQEVYQIRER